MHAHEKNSCIYQIFNGNITEIFYPFDKKNITKIFLYSGK